MRPESHLSLAPADVRDHPLARHGGAELEARRVFALVSAMGLPRYWPLVIRAALGGFTRAIASCTGSAAARLDEGVRGAQDALSRECDALIERMLPDASLVALLLDHDDLHAVSVGPGRVYVHRRGAPHRLTPRDDPAEGLLRGTPARCSHPIEPDDVILAGSVSAFSVRAIAKLASVLEADARTPPSVLASLLTEPAGQAGVGAVAIAMRIR